MILTAQVVDRGVRRDFERILSETRDLSPLMKVIGQSFLRWSAMNFEREGSPRWHPLSLGTSIARVTRRKGFQKLKSERARARAVERGLFRGRHRILQDRGLLRASATFHVGPRAVDIGYGEGQKARWAQFGTRPHTIWPRGEVLRWFNVDGTPAFATHVDHPGTPPRLILPTEQQMLEEMQVRALVEGYVGRIING